MSDWTKIKNFQRSEYVCRCGCGQCDMNQGHLVQMDQARDAAGIPFHINSGFRCKAHNIEVGGSETSSHPKGFASDIETGDNSVNRFLILRGLIVAGFRRIEIGIDYIHADNDPDKDQRVLWLHSLLRKAVDE